MNLDGERSVTDWIRDLKAGVGDDVARRLWDRYFDRLARLAHGRLKAAAHGPADGEDVALSAFDSFFRGAAEGRFPQLSDRDDLWKLLVTITARKASNQRRREHQPRRGGGRVVCEADLGGPDPDAGDVLAQVVGGEPTPEFAAAMADELGRRFRSLRDESLRVAALLRMDGHSNEEIAAALDCSLRSVERKLELIRKAWERELAS